jgi:hypothetical protein
MRRCADSDFDRNCHRNQHSDRHAHKYPRPRWWLVHDDRPVRAPARLRQRYLLVAASRTDDV